MRVRVEAEASRGTWSVITPAECATLWLPGMADEPHGDSSFGVAKQGRWLTAGILLVYRSLDQQTPCIPLRPDILGDATVDGWVL